LLVTGLEPGDGAELFISPRTVEYHFHEAFTELDGTFRSQPDRALPDAASPQAV
jgi:hypothetical protein